VTCISFFGPRIASETAFWEECRIRKSRSTDEQMVAILREAEREALAFVAKREGKAY
jgi:hypothetical protein